MGHSMKIAVVKNAMAIWEFDPTQENQVLGGSLDVITAICTLTIKVCTYIICLCAKCQSLI